MTLTFEYFPVRGRGEVIRLLLAYKQVDYKEINVDRDSMKNTAGSAEYPFGQAPILHTESGLKLAQMDAILRYLGRAQNMYGSNNEESSLIDMVLVGVEDIRSKYYALIYQDSLADDAKKEYQNIRLEEASEKVRNGGAHFRYLENILKRNNNGTGFIVGDSMSIADLHVFDLVDLHVREALFPLEMKEKFPLLVAHHERLSNEANIAAYLTSDKRPAQVNGVKLG